MPDLGKYINNENVCNVYCKALYCFSSRDSKDVVQAEKDLEEIKKLIEESGGKLSNRSLGSEVSNSLLASRRCCDQVQPQISIIIIQRST